MQRKILFLFVGVLLIGTVLAISEITNPKLTRSDIDSIDYKTEDFGANYSRIKNGSITPGDSSSRTGAHYIPLNMTIPTEEIIVQEIFGVDQDGNNISLIEENRTGLFTNDTQIINIKYFPSIIQRNADEKGQTYEEALDEYLDLKREKQVSKYRYRGENILQRD